MTDYVRDQFDDESISQELLDIAEERAAPPPAAPSAPPAGKPRARRTGFIILAILIALAAIGYGTMRLLAPPAQDTDDAYVGGNIVSITARQGGTVLALHADNTQRVAQGDTLIDLDPALQDVALASAEAKLGQAVRDVRSGQSAVAEGSAEVAKAQSDLVRAQADYSRRSSAAASGAISGEELSHAQDAVSSARAALDLAAARRGQAASAVAGTDVANNPQVLAAIAEVRKAAIDRAYMTLKAPVTGIVAQRNVQLGQQVAAGAPLMAVVPLDTVWIDANFRETPACRPARRSARHDHCRRLWQQGHLPRQGDRHGCGQRQCLLAVAAAERLGQLDQDRPARDRAHRPRCEGTAGSPAASRPVGQGDCEYVGSLRSAGRIGNGACRRHAAEPRRRPAG